MNKKDLSEAITEGIDKSLGQIAKGMFQGCVIVLVIIILIAVISAVIPRRAETIAATSIDQCDKPYVHCTIYDENEGYLMKGSLCGWFEAYAWIDSKQAELDDYNIRVECD